ncbi:hypothetical protein JTB14_024276 [Gonioctena quinquepunctata]|nr:hypothetical protein JTB14_024276 [Gonioctena quinquepunctata]
MRLIKRRGLIMKTVVTRQIFKTGFPKQLDETTKEVFRTKDSKLERAFEIIQSVNITTDRKETSSPHNAKFSDWNKLLRVTAWIIKITKVWISKIRQRNCSKRLSMEDMNEAEVIWIQKCQLDGFPEELNELRKKNN